MNGEARTLRRTYRFPAIAPFSLGIRSAQCGSNRLLLEATLENVTGMELTLNEADLDLNQDSGLKATLLKQNNQNTKDNIVHHFTTNQVHSLCFEIVKKDNSDFTDIKNSLKSISQFGRVKLSWWAKSSGPGKFLSANVVLLPLASPRIDIGNFECPTEVNIEESFTCTFDVVNRGNTVADVQLTCIPRSDQTSDTIVGQSTRTIGLIEPGKKVNVSIEMFCIAPGLQPIQGFGILDKNSGESFTFDSVGHVFAL